MSAHERADALDCLFMGGANCVLKPELTRECALCNTSPGPRDKTV